MRDLRDTHVELWMLADSLQLSVRARKLLTDLANDCWANSARVWEIAIKVGLGKHRLNFPLALLEAAIAKQDSKVSMSRCAMPWPWNM